MKAEDDNLNNTLSDLKQKDNIYQKQIAAIGVNDINEYYHLQKKLTSCILNKMVTNHHLVKINS